VAIVYVFQLRAVEWTLMAGMDCGTNHRDNDLTRRFGAIYLLNRVATGAVARFSTPADFRRISGSGFCLIVDLLENDGI
jgi:hypothetical protein